MSRVVTAMNTNQRFKNLIFSALIKCEHEHLIYASAQNLQIFVELEDKVPGSMCTLLIQHNIEFRKILAKIFVSKENI